MSRFGSVLFTAAMLLRATVAHFTLLRATAGAMGQHPSNINCPVFNSSSHTSRLNLAFSVSDPAFPPKPGREIYVHTCFDIKFSRDNVPEDCKLLPNPKDNRGGDCTGQLSAGANVLSFDAERTKYLVLYTTDGGCTKEIYPKEGTKWAAAHDGLVGDNEVRAAASCFAAER